MYKINWVRLLVGGLIATVILFITDAVFHERVVSADWKLVYQGLGVGQPQHDAPGILYFAVFELGRGLISIYLYALMRLCCSPGIKRAALAGTVAWIAFSVTGPAQFIPLGFYSNALWAKAAGFQLVTSVLAAIVGAFFYKDTPTSSA